jgi:DNA adenine methylase
VDTPLWKFTGTVPVTAIPRGADLPFPRLEEHLPLPEHLRSFLKWAGGKARTASVLSELAPPNYARYIEPFCGSAAVFLSARPERALLADQNEDLVVCLRQVARRPHRVMALLDTWPNEREFFNEVRAWDPDKLDPLTRSARVIYLNKTSFRGLWRVNRSGAFNTPYGAYDRPYYNRDTLLAASRALRSADIRHADFREVLTDAQPGDWVYLDPPYVPDRAWGDFTRYTAGRFGPDDQKDLALLCQELDYRGVRWLLTNSDTELVRELYDGYPMAALPTRRDITLQSADRASRDLVVSNYSPPSHEELLPT